MAILPLAQDIRADYLQMYDDYFNTIELPKFEILKINKETVGS